MRIRVAVVDPLPLCGRGVVAALADLGYPADTPDDVWAWLSGTSGQAVVLGVVADRDWRLLAELHEARPALPVLAMLDRPDVRGYVRAVRAGAAGAVARTGTPSALQQAFTALVNGQVLVPAEVMRALAADDRGEPAPSDQELAWLRQLARGSTVAALARSAGYSERMMFRRLRELYGRLPARNRTEALIHARDNGWI